MISPSLNNLPLLLSQLLQIIELANILSKIFDIL